MPRKKKVHFLKSVILASQSPGSNKQLNLESATPLSLPTTSPSQALKETYGQLKDKRDKLSNTVKRAILTTMGSGARKKDVRKLGASYATYKKVDSVSLETLLLHVKGKMKTRPPKLTENVKDAITEF